MYENEEQTSETRIYLLNDTFQLIIYYFEIKISYSVARIQKPLRFLGPIFQSELVKEAQWAFVE